MTGTTGHVNSNREETKEDKMPDVNTKSEYLLVRDELDQYLAGQRKSASFASITYTKKGAPRGRGVSKKVYGNDRIAMSLVTGFSYTNLCARSLTKLSEITDKAILKECLRREYLDSRTGEPVSKEDVSLAREELGESLKDSEAGNNSATHDHVFDPLVVDGAVVKGGRVYKCVGKDRKCHCRECNPDNKRAAIPGSRYLAGLKVWDKVLVPAENGPIPASKSSGKVYAKKVFRSLLPISKYVSLTLHIEQEPILKLGGLEKIEVT